MTYLHILLAPGKKRPLLGKVCCLLWAYVYSQGPLLWNVYCLGPLLGYVYCRRPLLGYVYCLRNLITMGSEKSFVVGFIGPCTVYIKLKKLSPAKRCSYSCYVYRIWLDYCLPRQPGPLIRPLRRKSLQQVRRPLFRRRLRRPLRRLKRIQQQLLVRRRSRLHHDFFLIVNCIFCSKKYYQNCFSPCIAGDVLQYAVQ